ncbi:MAG TPA: HAD family hydrolase [Methanomassiliicoccales archaeon]|nr:HAD family hydrolase [Methanomassiliicoccales archaeon]
MNSTDRLGLNLKALKAVIFDLDGTLIQSTIDFKAMNQAVAETLIQHGLPKDILDTKGRINESIVRAYAYFKGHSQNGWMDRLENDLNRVSAAVEMRQVDRTTVVPGTFEVLDHLNRNGLSVAILTRGSRPYTLRALRASGLEGYFRTIVCRDDYPLIEAKPNPIALRRVFADLGMEKQQCLFIGDHETDYQCAISAETSFAAVLTGSHGQEVWSRIRPDLLMSSIAELPRMLEGGS